MQVMIDADSVSYPVSVVTIIAKFTWTRACYMQMNLIIDEQLMYAWHSTGRKVLFKESLLIKRFDNGHKLGLIEFDIV